MGVEFELVLRGSASAVDDELRASASRVDVEELSEGLSLDPVDELGGDVVDGKLRADVVDAEVTAVVVAGEPGGSL